MPSLKHGRARKSQRHRADLGTRASFILHTIPDIHTGHDITLYAHYYDAVAGSVILLKEYQSNNSANDHTSLLKHIPICHGVLSARRMNSCKQVCVGERRFQVPRMYFVLLKYSILHLKDNQYPNDQFVDRAHRNYSVAAYGVSAVPSYKTTCGATTKANLARID